MVPLIITLNPCTEFLPAVLATLGSVGLEVSVPKRGMLPLGDTIVVLCNWKMRAPRGWTDSSQ